MQKEIEVALDFLEKLLSSASTDAETVKLFREKFSQALHEKYASHWFPASPTTGSGYRCIRWERRRGDKDLLTAAEASGLDARSVFPEEFTLWVDPGEVSARLGQRGGIFDLHVAPGRVSTSNSPVTSPKMQAMSPRQHAGMMAMMARSPSSTLPPPPHQQYGWQTTTLSAHAAPFSPQRGHEQMLLVQ